MKLYYIPLDLGCSVNFLQFNKTLRIRSLNVVSKIIRSIQSCSNTNYKSLAMPNIYIWVFSAFTKESGRLWHVDYSMYSSNIGWCSGRRNCKASRILKFVTYYSLVMQVQWQAIYRGCKKGLSCMLCLYAFALLSMPTYMYVCGVSLACRPMIMCR